MLTPGRGAELPIAGLAGRSATWIVISGFGGCHGIANRQTLSDKASLFFGWIMMNPHLRTCFAAGEIQIL